MKVVLKKHEALMAAQVGLRREISSWGSSEYNEASSPNRGWNTDIEAACAELAFAKYKNWYWDGSVGTFQAPDVGDVQVRHTEYSGGKLILRPFKTKPIERYVLVTGKCPEYHIRGWILGGDGMVDEYLVVGLNNGPPCWMIPQDSLNDIKDLV